MYNYFTHQTPHSVKARQAQAIHTPPGFVHYEDSVLHNELMKVTAEFMDTNS